MDELFATGNQVWRFFEALLDPARYARILEIPWVAGGVFFLLVLGAGLWAKNRKARLERRQRLQELEQALLDEDTQEHGLRLQEHPPDYEEDWDEEDPAAGTPVLSRGGLVQDPAFGGQIVIGPDSARKKESAPAVSPAAPEKNSESEIEAEFAKFARELQQKQLEVRRRHEPAAPQTETPAAPLLLDASDMLIEEEPTAPLVLDASDMLTDEESSSDLFAEDDLEDLLQPDPPETAEETQGIAALEAEMEETLSALSRGEEPYEEEPVPAEPEPGPDPKIQRERLVQRLEDFQRDLEHRFQSRTLRSLADRNFELVESLRDPEQTPEFQATLQEKQSALSTLETLMFSGKAVKR